MIIMINSSFGAGKTTVANILGNKYLDMLGNFVPSNKEPRIEI